MLLSDLDHSVGAAYEVTRDDDDPYLGFPRRYSYLIDPDGVIRRSYDVADVSDHAARVEADLVALKASS